MGSGFTFCDTFLFEADMVLVTGLSATEKNLASDGWDEMKTDCSHLPKAKKDELEKVVALITSSCDDVAMIVLYGSYARGSWKEEKDLKPERKSGHASDYDILVVVKNKSFAEGSSIWHQVERKSRELNLSTHIRIIAHDIEYLNMKLAEGQYFFTDIVTEGCLLYSTGQVALSQKRELTPKEKRRIAQDYYDCWFGSAKDFFELYTYAVTGKKLKKAAFLLHQCAESTYKAILLVFSDYCPHEHYLNILNAMAAEYDPAISDIFPRDTEEAEERLELLNYAYIGARYDMHYWIAKEDLELLAPCVERLLNRTKEICTKEIERLCPLE